MLSEASGKVPPIGGNFSVVRWQNRTKLLRMCKSGRVAEDVRNQAESEECAESGEVADDVRVLAMLQRVYRIGRGR